MILTGKNNDRNCRDGRHKSANMKLTIYQERLYSMQCKESRKRIPKGN